MSERNHSSMREHHSQTMTLSELCRYLRLHFVRENYQSLAQEALSTQQPYDEYLRLLLENEILQKQADAIQRRIKDAHFPQKLFLDGFDKSVYDARFVQKFAELETLDFIAEKQNLILLGATGAGKTFYATALGLLACQMGKKVLFVSVADLIIRLKEVMNQGQITAYKRRFETYELVIIDELGYFSFGKEIAELFFAILSTRDKKGSIIITSNLDFDEWPIPLGDPKLTAALISRLNHRSHIVHLERAVDGRMQDTLDWLSRHNLTDSF